MSHYCRIHGLVCSDVIESDGVSVEGGERGSELLSYPGRPWGHVVDKGRQPRTYRFRARFLGRTDLEQWLAAVNSTPVDAEVFPWEDDRSFYTAQVDAKALKAELAANPLGGSVMWLYRAEAKILSREPWLYGPDQGIDYATDVSLPQVSDLLTNNGQVAAGLDYLLLSGDYYGGLYTTEVLARLTPNTAETTDKQITLCDKLMRNDVFLLNRWGEVLHYYETDFSQTIADFQIDLHGGATGCSISSPNHLAMPNGASWVLPFYGPLPISENPFLDVYVETLAGQPVVSFSFDPAWATVQTIAHTWTTGWNRIYFPDCIGEDFVGLIVWCSPASGSSMTITSLKGTVKRYVAQSTLGLFEPDDTFKIRVEDAAGSNHRLKAIEACYRDLFWY